MTERYADGVGRTVVVEGERLGWIGARTTGGPGSCPPPPNLPLEGGRDELGEEGELGGRGVVPACAGMTEGAWE